MKGVSYKVITFNIQPVEWKELELHQRHPARYGRVLYCLSYPSKRTNKVFAIRKHPFECCMDLNHDSRRWLVATTLNPITNYIQLVRAPLGGLAPPSPV